MRNVAGLSTADAQKSSDMFAKCRYLDEITGGRGIVFATGTPISNSMTEMYSIQRYLQYDRLQAMGMAHFDCWHPDSAKQSHHWNWHRKEPDTEPGHALQNSSIFQS